MALFLQFEIGGDRYLLETSEVVVVLPLPELKRLPGAIDGVAGVANYQAGPVPVIDLALLAMGRSSMDRLSTRLVMVRYPTSQGGRLLGLIAERATGVLLADEKAFSAAGVSAAPWLGEVTPGGAGGSGMAQRIKVAELLSPELRSVLFQAVEEVA